MADTHTAKEPRPTGEQILQFAEQFAHTAESLCELKDATERLADCPFKTATLSKLFRVAMELHDIGDAGMNQTTE